MEEVDAIHGHGERAPDASDRVFDVTRHAHLLHGRVGAANHDDLLADDIGLERLVASPEILLEEKRARIAAANEIAQLGGSARDAEHALVERYVVRIAAHPYRVAFRDGASRVVRPDEHPRRRDMCRAPVREGERRTPALAQLHAAQAVEIAKGRAPQCLEHGAVGAVRRQLEQDEINPTRPELRDLEIATGGKLDD